MKKKNLILISVMCMSITSLSPISLRAMASSSEEQTYRHFPKTIPGSFEVPDGQDLEQETVPQQKNVRPNVSSADDEDSEHTQPDEASTNTIVTLRWNFFPTVVALYARDPKTGAALQDIIFSVRESYEIGLYFMGVKPEKIGGQDYHKVTLTYRTIRPEGTWGETQINACFALPECVFPTVTVWHTPGPPTVRYIMIPPEEDHSASGDAAAGAAE